MALPVTIASIVGFPGHHPPFKSSAGAFYVVGLSATDQIDIYKATDPTDSFSIQDAANNPTTFTTLHCLSARQKGDVIHIAAMRLSLTTLRANYFTFNMATDLWVLNNNVIELFGTTNLPTNPWISIDVRSDGDVVVVYAGVTDQVMGGKKERVDGNIRTGGTWGGAVALDAAGDIHYGNPNVVYNPTTDRMHLLWQTTANTTDPPTAWTDQNARSLDASNNLSSLVTSTQNSGDALLGNSNIVHEPGSALTEGHCISLEGGQTRLIDRRIDSFLSDDATGISTIQATTQDPYVNGEVGVCTIAIDSANDLHALFAGGGVAGVDQDLYYVARTSGTWTGLVEEIDALTINFISANIYVRGGDTVLAYIYDDGGVQKYNEKVLVVGAVAFLPLLEQKQNTLLRM